MAVNVRMPLVPTAVNLRYIGEVVGLLLDTKAHHATKYLTDHKVIRATRRLSRGKIDHRAWQDTVILTLGGPNYRERDFIKLAKKEGYKFPIDKVQLKYPPKRKS